MPFAETTAGAAQDRSKRVSTAVRRGGVLLAWSLAFAFLMSTEFLFQPFIWRNYDLHQIGESWAGLLRDRAVVACALALALALAGAAPLTGEWRTAGVSVAVVGGAAAGELLLSQISPQADRQDIVSLIGRIVRWCLVGGAVAGMFSVWRSGAQLAAAAEEARIGEAQARRLDASSQLEALRRQIEPHFLFNTLATIRRLQETDPQEGQRLLGRLFTYMSSTLGGAAGARTTLGDEIELVRAYLDVCASRLSGRLAVRVEVDDALRAMDFPPLVLATLAENAVKHGVFPQNGGEVLIVARDLGDRVEVSLCDDGVGLSGETGGGGMGLANIAERLRLLYGPGAGLSLEANVPRGVCARLRLPRQAGA